MKLKQTFEVRAPIEQVWAALTDVERIAPCLPGAVVSGRNEDGSYSGSFSVKVGPTSAAYTGRLEMRGLDHDSHQATMHAQGTDRRGQGGAEATIVSTVSEIRPGVAAVTVDTDYRITGRLARFGRGGMIEDISEKLLRQFADRLQASLQDSGSAAAANPRSSAAGAGARPVAGEGSSAGSPSRAGVETASAPGAEPRAPANEISALSVLGSVTVKRIRRDPLPYAVAVLATLGWWRAWRRRGRESGPREPNSDRSPPSRRRS